MKLEGPQDNIPQKVLKKNLEKIYKLEKFRTVSPF
jgi:hypothetical protein